MEIVFTPEEKADWERLTLKLKAQFNNQDMKTEALLLLIGLREVGIAPREFKKEEKVDLIHVGTCAILPEFYQEIGRDQDGWPHYELTKVLPFLDIFAQVNFIRLHVLRYFKKVYGDSFFDS